MEKSPKFTKRQKEVLKIIYSSLKSSGYPPTLADLRDELKVSSNQGVLDMLQSLERKGYIKREEGAARGIKILQKGFEALVVKPVVPMVGVTAAGPYKDAFENLDWKEWNRTEIADNVFIVKVSGDSMVGAGYEDGDCVLVQETKEFRNKEIVLARSDDGTTIKRLISEAGRTYLKPENPKYANIPIYPETRLLGRIIGKIQGESI